MNRTRRYATMAVAGIAALGGLAMAAGPSAAAEPETAGPSVTGCVVRFTENGPRILDDAKHDCTGATGVSVNSAGDLVVDTTATGTVISVAVDEDETLSLRGIVAGASVAVGTTRVSFYSTERAARIPADGTELRGPNANIWLTWVNAA